MISGVPECQQPQAYSDSYHGHLRRTRNINKLRRSPIHFCGPRPFAGLENYVQEGKQISSDESYFIQFHGACMLRQSRGGRQIRISHNFRALFRRNSIHGAFYEAHERRLVRHY